MEQSRDQLRLPPTQTLNPRWTWNVFMCVSEKEKERERVRQRKSEREGWEPKL